MTTDDLENNARAPAPLGLPFGKLFFGYPVIPYKEPAASVDVPAPQLEVSVIIYLLRSSSLLYLQSTAFSGSGQTLAGGSRSETPSQTTARTAAPPQSKANWGKGNTLNGREVTGSDD